MTSAKGSDGGRYGGYGQSGYGEEEADEPGVQADFDEEENREAEGPTTEGTESKEKEGTADGPY